jgi:3-methyladenine DNA glycosylase/8-oxoguanine DNA glycosylase
MTARAVAHLRRADPVLARVMAAVGPCRYRLHGRVPPFSALVSSICYQQISGFAAAAILRRLQEAAGRRHPRPREVSALSDETLRAVGLSRQKISYLRDLCRKAEEGVLRRLHRLDDEAVIEALSSVRGIGRWTAEMFLMFRLGRPDVLPVDDYGIRKAMQGAYRLRALPKADWMRRKAEAWRPHRTIACWYLWQSVDRKLTKRPPRAAAAPRRRRAA